METGKLIHVVLGHCAWKEIDLELTMRKPVRDVLKRWYCRCRRRRDILTKMVGMNVGITYCHVMKMFSSIMRKLFRAIFNVKYGLIE